MPRSAKLSLYEAFVSRVLQLIDERRPETWGVHSHGFDKSVGSPWNKNESVDPIEVQGGLIEFLVTAPKPHVVLETGHIALQIDFHLRALLVWDSEKQPLDFSSRLTATLDFAEETDAGPPGHLERGFPLRAISVNLKGLAPPPVAEILNWYLARAISASLKQGTYVPKAFAIEGTTLKATMERPAIHDDRIDFVAGV